MRERAKAGFQHSSKMVSWTRSTQPLVWGTPRPDGAVLGSQAGQGGPEVRGAELAGVVGGDRLQTPAPGRQVSGHTAGQLGGPFG